MPVLITVQKHISGSHYPINGRQKTGKYRALRHPNKSGYPQIVFPTAEAYNKVAEDILLGPNNPPMVVTVIPEVAEGDAGLTERVTAAEKARDEATGQLDELRQEIEKLKEAQPASDAAELEALLEPLAIDADNTPADTLRRILNPPVPPQPEDYEDKLAWAKRYLGCTFDKKPNKADLQAAIDAKLAGQ